MVDCSIDQWGQLSGDEVGPLGLDYYYIYYCSPPQFSWLLLFLVIIWIVFLINLLAQTASNYFSPTLSNICDKLNLAYDIAGVTFLAFGNGAPDFFSLIASFSGGVDVLVGVGALLGGSMFVCTVVVGSIAILCPCEVSRQLFLRDISFHLFAVISVGLVSLVRDISVGVASCLLIVYLVYCTTVIISSCFNKETKDSISVAGDIVMTSFGDQPTSSMIQTAFWHSDPNQKIRQKAKKAFSFPTTHDGITGAGGYSFLILKDDDDVEASKEKSEETHEEDGTINISGGFEPSFDDIIKEDYYGNAERTFTIGEAPIEQGYEDSSDSLQQSLLHPEETPPHEQDEVMTRLRVEKGLKTRNFRQYQHILSSLYWQQWSVRRKFRRVVIATEWETYSILYKCYLYFEYPLCLARDLTIPILEDNNWNKIYATLHPITCPLFALFVFAAYTETIFNIPLVVSCLLLGFGPSIYIYLYTTNSRPPSNPIFKVVWTLTAFVMCVMWVYTFAGELISCLSAVGKILSIPPAFLGLTILAWGNSIGDFFTNTAVAKQGLGAMAIAGCYAGPVFNILMGFGVALTYATIQSYPHAYSVVLDTSSKVSICFLVLAISSTIGIVSYRDFKLDRLFGFYLLTLYAVYSVVQITLVALN